MGQQKVGQKKLGAHADQMQTKCVFNKWLFTVSCSLFKLTYVDQLKLLDILCI